MGRETLQLGSEHRPLVTNTEPLSKHSDPQSRSQLIREWIVKLAMNAGQALDATSFGVYQALWEEGFEDLSYAVLQMAFKKTLRECKYWPIKVADVRERVETAKKTAVLAAAEVDWQRLLVYCCDWVNPDIRFSRAPKPPERIDRAARAAGGLLYLRQCSTDELQWAKKRFIEAYVAWEDLEQDQFLLPDGELKNRVARVAAKKVLSDGPSRE